jgi:hypothetical protein
MILNAHFGHRFQRKMKDLAEMTHGESLGPPLKGKERALAKSRFKYTDPRQRSQITNPDSGSGDDLIAYFRLTDILRDTLVFENLPDMYTALEHLESDEDIQIIEFNDRYFFPLGDYRDLQLTIKFESVVAELQLNTRVVLGVKKNMGHDTFAVQRELRAAITEGSVDRCWAILRWARDTLGSTAGERIRNCLNDATSSSGCFLHQAAKGGQAGIIACLLFYHANPDLQAEGSGKTPLHTAMIGKDLDSSHCSAN